MFLFPLMTFSNTINAVDITNDLIICVQVSELYDVKRNYTFYFQFDCTQNASDMLLYLALIRWINITISKAFSANLALLQFTSSVKFGVTGVTLTNEAATNVGASMLTWISIAFVYI